MAALAQQESESLSANVRLGIQFRNQAGKVQVNHNRFLGYTKDESGTLVIVPEEAEIVRRIYAEYMDGQSFLQIKRGLEADGILNGAGNAKWHESNIKQILTNEKYIGDALLQKTYTVNTLEKKRVANNGLAPKYYVEGSHEALKGCLPPGAGRNRTKGEHPDGRQETNLQFQVRFVEPCVLRTLRRHLPQDQVEQPRLQINGLAVREPGAEKEQRH